MIDIRLIFNIGQDEDEECLDSPILKQIDEDNERYNFGTKLTEVEEQWTH